MNKIKYLIRDVEFSMWVLYHLYITKRFYKITGIIPNKNIHKLKRDIIIYRINGTIKNPRYKLIVKKY